MDRRIAAAGALSIVLLALVAIALFRREPVTAARTRPPSAAPIAMPERAIPVPAPEPPQVTQPPAVAVEPAPASGEPPKESEERPDPIIAIPGVRFEVDFPDWRPPVLPIGCGWRLIGYRESLTGCRRVGGLPLGGPLRAQVYRTVPDPDPEASVAIAVFLIARAYGSDGAPFDDRVHAHAAEAYLRADEILELGVVELRALASTVDFTVRFEEAPPDLIARGWFDHAANESASLSRDPTGLPPGSFPRQPEAFADENGRLRFAGARFEAALDPMGSLEVTGWPRGLLWPSSFELGHPRTPLGTWEIADPPVRAQLLARGIDVDPKPATPHVYRRRAEVEMPPIELVGAPLSEGWEREAIVIATGADLSAEARVSPRSGTWTWRVDRARVDRGQSFSAILIAPGAEVSWSQGRTGSDTPVRFLLRPAGGEIVLAEWVVAPGFRTDIPILYELELRCPTRDPLLEGRAIAEQGRFALPHAPRNCSWGFAAEVDAGAWARRLEDLHLQRWGRSIAPLDLRAETIGRLASGATVLEVIVETKGEEWPLAEFLEEFGLSP